MYTATDIKNRIKERNKVKARLAEAGFEVADLGDSIFRLSIAEEE